MTSKYDKSRHVLVEQPQVMKPDQKAWNEYISSLRTIPCVPGSIWEEDKIYEENVDYKVTSVESRDWDGMLNGTITTAAPIPKEDDLWRDLIDEITEGFDDENLTDKLRAKYTITKKTV